MTFDQSIAPGPAPADLAPLYAHMGAAALDAHLAALIPARAAADRAVGGLASALKRIVVALEDLGVAISDEAVVGLDALQEDIAEHYARTGDRAALDRMLLLAEAA